MSALKVVGIAGSLRESSFNKGLLRAAKDLVPDGMEITIHSIADIPLYNGDVEAEGIPEAVVSLGEAIKEADALIIATPEYNYSIPGVLKNALDWLSRLDDEPLAGKPAAIMGASAGMLGTGRAQYHLRQVFVFLEVQALLMPEVLVPFAHLKFDEAGNLTDESTRERVKAQLEALARWVKKLS